MSSGRPGACFKLPVCSSACADFSSNKVVPGTCSIELDSKIKNPISDKLPDLFVYDINKTMCERRYYMSIPRPQVFPSGGKR